MCRLFPSVYASVPCWRCDSLTDDEDGRLDFENAISDPNFFDTHLNKVYEKLLSFPIPTVASIGGHAL